MTSLAETADYSRYLGRQYVYFSYAALTPNSMNLTKLLVSMVKNEEFRVVHQTSGKFGASAKKDDTHVYNKPEGKLQFTFVA